MEGDEKSPYPDLSPPDLPATWVLPKGGFATYHWFPDCGFQKHCSDQTFPFAEVLCALAQPEP